MSSLNLSDLSTFPTLDSETKEQVSHSCLSAPQFHLNLSLRKSHVQNRAQIFTDFKMQLTFKYEYKASHANEMQGEHH